MEEMFKKAKLEQQKQFTEDVKDHVDCVSSKILENSDTCRQALENHYLKTGTLPSYTSLSECVFKSGKLLYKNGRDPLAASGVVGSEEYSDSLNNVVRKTISEKYPHVEVNGFNEKKTFWSNGNYFNYNITIKKEHYPHLNKN